MNAVETRGLSRVFDGDVVALNNVTLTVPANTVHALLGPNGAGKTTLVKILATMLSPTAGFANVLGYDVTRDTRNIRRAVGVALGGDKGLYQNLSARELLAYWCALYHVPRREIARRVDLLIAQVGLQEKANVQCRGYSRGMRQRLHLARSLVGNPDLVIMDEPTIGLDPVSLIQLRALISNLRREGKTVLITTHDLREAELLCDGVTLIDRGEVLVSAQPAALAAILGRKTRIWFRPSHSLSDVDALPWPSTAIAAEDRYEIESDDEEVTANVMRWLLDHGVRELGTRAPSLEEVYLHYVGRSTRAT